MQQRACSRSLPAVSPSEAAARARVACPCAPADGSSRLASATCCLAIRGCCSGSRSRPLCISRRPLSPRRRGVVCSSRRARTLATCCVAVRGCLASLALVHQPMAPARLVSEVSSAALCVLSLAACCLAIRGCRSSSPRLLVCISRWLLSSRLRGVVCSSVCACVLTVCCVAVCADGSSRLASESLSATACLPALAVCCIAIQGCCSSPRRLLLCISRWLLSPRPEASSAAVCMLGARYLLYGHLRLLPELA